MVKAMVVTKMLFRTKQRTVASSGRQTIKVVLPIELISLLKLMARRRSFLSGIPVEVSDLVFEFLERHRADIENEAQSPMRV